MTAGQRGGLAVAFVALIAVVLARPVITADDEPTATALPAATETPAETVTPEPPPTAAPTEDATPTPTPVGPPDELEGDYPDECLAAQALPSPGAVVAVDPGGEVVAAPVTGGAVVTLRPEGRGFPAGFSPSGNYIAYGAGGIATAEGEVLEPLAGATPIWAWSPQADCLLALTDPSVLVVHIPGGETEELLAGPITSFAISPSGDRIVVFGDDIALAYDLRSGQAIGEPVAVPNPSEPLVWKGNTLYYGTSRGPAFDVGGVKVGGDAVNEAPPEVTSIAPGSQAKCAGRILAVSPDGDLIDLDQELIVAGPDFDFGRPSCGPDGSFIAVPRRPPGSPPQAFRLVALDDQGGFVSRIGTGGAAEVLPDWGPPGTGIVFLSTASRSAPGEIIYASSSGGTTLPFQVGRFRGFDWSATAPTGIPGTRI